MTQAMAEAKKDDPFKALQDVYYQKFWDSLDAEKDVIEGTINKFLGSYGISYDLWDDFRHNVYEICAKNMHTFDESRSDIKTWIVWQARSLMSAVIRNGGGRNSLKFDLCFSDFEKEDAEGEIIPMEQIVSGMGVSDDPTLIERQVEGVFKTYALNLEAHKELVMRDIFDILVKNGFEISDREIARTIGRSPTTVAKGKAAVLYELRLCFIKEGLRSPDSLRTV